MRNHSASLFVTPKDERRAQGAFRKLTELADELREHCNSVSVSVNEWSEDEDLTTDPEGELYHDQKTLVKVRNAIRECLPPSGADILVDVIVNAILNEGVLFREKRS